MTLYVVQFHDAFGHREVRKVCRSIAGAQSYITSALIASFATEIVWASDGTDCTAWANFRGPQGGVEFVSYSIERHELVD